MPGRFVTTGAVLTEAMHFLGPLRAAPKRLLEFLRTANLQVLDVFSKQMLNRAAALMEQYADIPMDFADATLVAAAEKFQISAIVTLDETGFRAFRYRSAPSPDALSALALFGVGLFLSALR